MKKSLLDLSIRMLPLLVLFIGSIYLSYMTWQKYEHTDLWLLVLFLGIVLLSLFSMGYVFYTYRKEEKKDRSLFEVVSRINDLSVNISNSSSLDNLLINIKQREDIYSYIDKSFHLLHDKGKKIEDEAEAKSQFLSTMSHEIRTPLNGIIGFTKLLKELGATQDQEEFLSLIENSSNNLISIVNDVLDLSKMNAEKMEIEQTSFDIFETIELTVASLAQQADQKDIELGLLIDPSLSPYLIGDPTKLSQILTNLIGNAVKFTDAYGKINLFVQDLQSTDEEVKVKFSVYDDGIGLTDEQKNNIFEAYSQATTSTSRKYGGTGLGLTISNKMVKLMGGKLEVESSVDEGAVFFFTLALKKDNQHEPKEYPDFSNVSVGLALPVKSIKRQLDTNLETYVRHLGADFSFYYYEELFESDEAVSLPDIMIFDHHYARLAGELEQCASVECKSVLLTNGSLRSRINPEQHHFSDVVLMPVTLAKTIRVLSNVREKKQEEAVTSSIVKNSEVFQGLRALVADDNKINCKLIKIILEQLGLDVTVVLDGKDAFKMYRENEYDIIFMDIQMPIMDGIEANKNILAYESEHNLKHIPVIALTANTSPGEREKYIAEGMDDYAIKPLDPDALKSIIANCRIH
ncbi:MAG: response regulator [Sulfurovum sp.]|nr:MAG: response regulator [Sulfurovum sp.]